MGQCAVCRAAKEGGGRESEQNEVCRKRCTR